LSNISKNPRSIVGRLIKNFVIQRVIPMTASYAIGQMIEESLTTARVNQSVVAGKYQQGG
jgi:hypothetical protein